MAKKKMFFTGNLQDLNTGLVAAYQFENNIVDAVNGNNGSVTGSPVYNTGVNGNGIDFINDSSVNYATLPDSNNLSFTDGSGNDIPFTISFWVYFHAFSSSENSLLSKRPSSGTVNNEWSITHTQSTNTILVSLMSNTTANLIRVRSGVGLFTVGNWSMITISYDGSKLASGLRFYKNGIYSEFTNDSLGTYTGMVNSTSSVRVGQRNDLTGGNYKHKGKLDELYIWKNRVLNAVEISDLYNAGVGKFYPF